MGFILAVWGGPGMITKDFANNSVQLYLSRPLSRAEYLFGKVSVLGALLSCITWIPALFLFFVHAELQGNGWLWQNLWMAGSIFLASLLWIAVISLLSMAVSVWVKWRIAASALMFAVFFVLPILGFAMNPDFAHAMGTSAELALCHHRHLGASLPAYRNESSWRGFGRNSALVGMGFIALGLCILLLAA